jgi:hypothetical protein
LEIGRHRGRYRTITKCSRALTCNGGCPCGSLEAFLQAGQLGLILLVLLGPAVGKVRQGDELGVKVVGNEVAVPLVGEVDQSLRKGRGRIRDFKIRTVRHWFKTMREKHVL